jgi:hypothetical protein
MTFRTPDRFSTLYTETGEKAMFRQLTRDTLNLRFHCLAEYLWGEGRIAPGV